MRNWRRLGTHQSSEDRFQSDGRIFSDTLSAYCMDFGVPNGGRMRLIFNGPLFSVSEPWRRQTTQREALLVISSTRSVFFKILFLFLYSVRLLNF